MNAATNNAPAITIHYTNDNAQRAFAIATTIGVPVALVTESGRGDLAVVSSCEAFDCCCNNCLLADEVNATLD